MADKKSSKDRKGKARDSDRAFAARAVQWYDAGALTGDDLRVLLNTFARYGTLDVIGTAFSVAMREMKCREEFKRLRDAGETADGAIAAIVERYKDLPGYGERTVRGIVYSKLDLDEALARLAKKYPP